MNTAGRAFFLPELCATGAAFLRVDAHRAAQAEFPAENGRLLVPAIL